MSKRASNKTLTFGNKNWSSGSTGKPNQLLKKLNSAISKKKEESTSNSSKLIAKSFKLLLKKIPFETSDEKLQQFYRQKLQNEVDYYQSITAVKNVEVFLRYCQKYNVKFCIEEFFRFKFHLKDFMEEFNWIYKS